MLVWRYRQSKLPRDREAAYLDPSNPELDQGSEHLPSCDFVGCPTNGHFDEQAIVMRLTRWNYKVIGYVTCDDLSP